MILFREKEEKLSPGILFNETSKVLSVSGEMRRR